MRHHMDHRQLSRTAAHRRALLRRLVTALFEHERIETTVAKAKEARRVAERMITYAKRNNLHSRRLVARVVQDETVAKKLFDTITPWYTTREGGYTRILKTRRRLGDAGELAILELVKTEEQREKDRQKRAAAAAAKAKEKEEKKKKGKAEEAAEEKAEKPEKPVKAEKAPEPAAKEPKKPAPKPAAAEKAAEKKVEKKAEKKAEKKPGGLFGRIRKKKDTDS